MTENTGDDGVGSNWPLSQTQSSSADTNAGHCLPSRSFKTRPKLKLAETDSTKASASKAGAEDGDPADGLTGVNRRKLTRRTVLWPARLIVGRHEVACQIWNLSLGGARIRCDLPLRIGSPVTLSIAGKPALDAHVSWSEGDSLGLSFVDNDQTISRLFSDRLDVLGLG